MLLAGNLFNFSPFLMIKRGRAGIENEVFGTVPPLVLLADVPEWPNGYGSGPYGSVPTQVIRKILFWSAIESCRPHLYFLNTNQIYIFEFEMKTSPEKQRETIGKLFYKAGNF